MNNTPRLGVNIDHIATLRQLRHTPYPGLTEAAAIVESAGAEQITVHLREDRRHIQDADVKALRTQLRIPLNLEMAATDEMVRFAKKIGPDWVCLVPEKRHEVTTEGGLDLEKQKKRISTTVSSLQKVGIKVSLFVEPSTRSIRFAQELGADAVELHTGRFCIATQGGFGARSSAKAKIELARICKATLLAKKLGIRPHAGHGFDYDNVRTVVDQVPMIEEYNIGHAIICRAVLVGLDRAVREMVSAVKAP